jgi:hypothetical protein
MGHLEKSNMFQKAVEEYKALERDVAKSFLSGVIQLGELLKQQRDKWKPEGKWLEFLDKVNKHISGANQFIRLYEYSQDHMKTLVNASLDNWYKVNVFLALPEEVRQKISEEIAGAKLTPEEFKEKVTNLKEQEPPVNLMEVSDLPITSEKGLALMQEAALTDLPFASRTLLKALSKEGYEFSSACLPIIEAFLGLERVIKNLKPENFKRLTISEKRFWNKRIKQQAEKLNSIL